MITSRALAVISINLFAIGCRERDTSLEDKKRDQHANSTSTELQNTETKNLLLPRRQKQSHSDADSARDLLANCERLKLGDGSGVVSFSGLKEAYNKLAIANPLLALEQFSDPKAFFAIGPALYGVVEIAASKDPELLINWLNQCLTNYEDKGQAAPLISITLNQLAGVDPDKALAAFKNLNIPDNTKGAVISALFRGLGATDPLLAIKMASSLDPSLSSSALSGAANGAIKGDPKMATAIASEISDPEIRQRALDGVFAEWFKTDAHLAKAELMKMDQKTIEDMLVGGVLDPRSLVYSISRSDPLTLLSLLDEIYPTSVNRALFEKSVNETVKSRPEQTFSTIARLPEGEMKLSLYKEAYGALTKENSERALTMFSLEKNPTIRAAALPQIASSIGASGMDTTLRFLDQLTSIEDKSTAFSSAFNAIVHSDLESAANYLVDSEIQAIKLSPEERERGYKVVAFRIASADLGEARDWMSKLPQQEQPHAMSGIASQMAQRDVKALGEYLNSIEKDQVWAAGVKVLISTVEFGDAETANKWKQILKDTKLRKP